MAKAEQKAAEKAAAAEAKKLEAEQKAAEKAAAASAKSSTVVRYRNRVGVTIDRVYSKEQHGADFDELAKEFAEKSNGTIV
jgi:hypothetical protein